MELPTKSRQIKSNHTKVQYNLRIEPEMLEWLKAIGKEYERPVNYLINHAVKQMRFEIEKVRV